MDQVRLFRLSSVMANGSRDDRPEAERVSSMSRDEPAAFGTVVVESRERTYREEAQTVQPSPFGMRQ